MHTSASLALNESWDPDVRDDMEMMLNKIVPEGLPYRHSCEGPDDMVRYFGIFNLNCWVVFGKFKYRMTSFGCQHTFVYVFNLIGLVKIEVFCL